MHEIAEVIRFVRAVLKGVLGTYTISKAYHVLSERERRRTPHVILNSYLQTIQFHPKHEVHEKQTNDKIFLLRIIFLSPGPCSSITDMFNLTMSHKYNH